jgi:hypothetical protein
MKTKPGRGLFQEDIAQLTDEEEAFGSCSGDQRPFPPPPLLSTSISLYLLRPINISTIDPNLEEEEDRGNSL